MNEAPSNRLSSRAAQPAAEHDVPPPNLLLLALEFRAFWEASTLVPAWPVLRRAPAGDGHSVIIFPGLSASDSSTLPLRHYLGRLNYNVSGWNQGFNFGARAGVLDTVSHQVKDTFEATGKPVSLIEMILLHAFIKKTQQTNPADIELANKRLKEWKNGQIN